MKHMTPRQRLITTLNHSEPDQVPLDLGGTKVTGISMTAYRRYLSFKGWQELEGDPQVSDVVQDLAKVSEGVLQRLKVDTRGVVPASPVRPQYSCVGDYTQFRDEWGITWAKPTGKGLYFDTVAHPLGGDDSMPNLAKLSWPDPTDAERLSSVAQQVSTLKDGYGCTMHGLCAGVMEMALRLRGYEGFLTDLAIDSKRACGLLDKVTELKMAFWDRALQLVGPRVDVAVEADDLGTQTSLLISPEMYRRYLMPRHERLFSFIKKKAPHAKVFFHSCGAVTPLLPDLITAGIDILNPVQISAQGIDTKSIKKQFSEALVFWGGAVDTQQVLPHGSPSAVKDEVRRRIDDLAPGGGFVFASVHNVQADAPPENLEAMLNTFYDHCHY